MLKRYKNYSKRVKTDHWSQASFVNALAPRTAARASFASDEGLWVLVRHGTLARKPRRPRKRPENICAKAHP